MTINTKFKVFLIAVTLFAVVSDSMLIPFYPQFFAAAFAITDPQYVGIYLSACCFVVMLAFPGWAQLAKKVPTLKLLIYTQFAAGLLSILCYWTTSLLAFWFVSLTMLIFKASYLLIYPFVMSLEEKNKHGDTIGLLSVIVHFGVILGALLGGLVLQLYEPRQAFLVMALGDFLQMLVCCFLRVQQNSQQQAASSKTVPRVPVKVQISNTDKSTDKSAIYKLALVMLIFYFSAYLIRPFFVLYWKDISTYTSDSMAGLVFAIPAFMALLALWFNHRARRKTGVFGGIVSALLLGIAGLFLQASQQVAFVLIGRCLFGWALFQSTVHLDFLLFKLSTPQAYATDFSKIHFCQSLGVLIASFTAGSLVATYSLVIPFMIAALGFAITMTLYLQLFKVTSALTVEKQPGVKYAK